MKRRGKHWQCRYDLHNQFRTCASLRTELCLGRVWLRWLDAPECLIAPVASAGWLQSTTTGSVRFGLYAKHVPLTYRDQGTGRAKGSKQLPKKIHHYDASDEEIV